MSATDPIVYADIGDLTRDQQIVRDAAFILATLYQGTSRATWTKVAEVLPDVVKTIKTLK